MRLACTNLTGGNNRDRGADVDDIQGGKSFREIVLLLWGRKFHASVAPWEITGLCLVVLRQIVLRANLDSEISTEPGKC
jgi:hypothetical protein